MTTYVHHKRAHFDFDILTTYEAGISLLGTEVKSVRNGQAKLDGAYVLVRGKEAFLVGASISPFQQANTAKSYEAERPRKLLLTAKEITEIEERSEKDGLTVVPIKLYNKGRHIKLEIAIAKGKKKHDKRHSIQAHDVQRDVEREFKFRFK